MKTKISFILLIFIAFIAIFNSKCFADFEFISSDGNTYTIGDLPFDTETYPYYIILDESGSNRYKIIFSRVPFIANSSNGRVWTSNNSSCSNILYFKNSNSYNNSYGTSYTSHDILDSNGNVVFQVARQPVEETSQVVLAEIVENQEANKVMEEILGILPVIIIVLVSLIGLRKSFSFLKNLLKQS